MGSKARQFANLLGADGKIQASQFGDGTITADFISDDTVTSDKLAPNLELTGQYVKVPVGTTEERPGSPEVGHLRFNTTFGRLEQYVSDGWRAVDTPPTVTTLAYSGGLLGADPAGGETVTITGTNFQAGANVTFGDTAAASVTVNSSTSITATTPAKTAGDYDVKVTNSNGLSATLQNGISFNGLPAFTTPAGQIGDDLSPNTTISTITIVAAEPDGGTLSYSITSGAVPTGLTFDSDGTIDGTTPDLSSTTTYNFTVTATDDENQTNSRAFNLVVLRKIYAYSVPQSLMFDDGDSQYLTRTPASDGNRRTWTWSGWVKRSGLGTAQKMFAFGTPGTSEAGWTFQTNNTVEFYQYASGYQMQLVTTQVFRDVSAWYHIVVAVDTTQATASNRAKIYVNGVQITSFSTETYPSQNLDTFVNSSSHPNYISHLLGQTNYLDGYLTEVHLIDGQALTPTSFGETYNDVWTPKAYDGSYGTNGFYLPMTNDTSVEAFNTVTWYGDGTVSKDINGVGFEPDLIWFKCRTNADSHAIFDVIRGLDKVIFSNTSGSEQTDTGGRTITAVNSDGFTVGADGWSNRDNDNYVAWCWKAGDSNVSNTDGSVTSTVRANQTYGFSIVSYTGPGSGGGTVGHGLGAAPAFIIQKNRSATENWRVYHSSLPNNYYINLSGTGGGAEATSVWGGSNPTSTVFSIGNDAAVSGSGNSIITYCWTPKAGYSAFGSYTGNGSTDGPTITTGFKVGFLLVKGLFTKDWAIVDNTRSVNNPTSNELFPNTTAVEATDQRLNWLADGFKIVSSGAQFNNSGSTFIYAAFADTRDYAFWRDESGNNNDWQPVNTGAYRVTTDTPTE
jgi:hypothetical protein